MEKSTENPFANVFWGPASLNPALGPRVNLANPHCSEELQPPPSQLQLPSSGKGPLKTIPSPLETAEIRSKSPPVSFLGRRSISGAGEHHPQYCEHSPCTQVSGGCPAAGMGVPRAACGTGWWVSLIIPGAGGSQSQIFIRGISKRCYPVTLGIHHLSRCTHGVFGIQPLELWALKVKTPACAGAKALPPAPSLISVFRVQGKGRSGGRAVPFCWGNI